MKPDKNITIESFGIYSKWDSDKTDLPRIKEYTTNIPIGPDIEFGIILNIKKYKNALLRFRMEHPPFIEHGTVVPDFTGEEFVKTNDYRYYIGDRFWEPFEDKAGTWNITVWLNNNEVAQKSFTIKLHP